MHLPSFKGWTREQKHVVVASYLGWTLDAFDFFLVLLVQTDIAKTFGTKVTFVAWATALTLAARPLGAFIFGRLADHFGRRPVMMIDVMCYAGLAFISSFSPSLTVFLVLRALFGIAMGGEWGVGASLTMESIPAESRGLVSGILQAGYPSGYLLASLAYWVLFPIAGWRGLFMLGLLPALLVLYIRRSVPESPGWSHEHASANSVLGMLRRHWKLAIYATLLMAFFNFFSHGTQDNYPTFLKIDQGFGVGAVGRIQVIYNIGAIFGGLTFGSLSQRFGRRRTIITGALLSIFVLPLWAFAPQGNWQLFALGAFIMQFLVQGCWGIVPAHLNEISPPEARATFPGLVYQLGNLLAFYVVPLQTSLPPLLGAYAIVHAPDYAVQIGSYAMALVLVAAAAAIGVAIFAYVGREARDVDMQVEARQPA